MVGRVTKKAKRATRKAKAKVRRTGRRETAEEAGLVVETPPALHVTCQRFHADTIR